MNENGGVAALARFVTAAGVVAAVGGVIAWLVARAQLSRERIVVPSSASFLADRPVRGPVGAFAEAEAIRGSALAATGGRTYGELEHGDPMAPMAMNASLLRSSLMTSVLAFGIAATEVALGSVLIAIGAGMSRLARAAHRTV